jgi:hypothetical protein
MFLKYILIVQGGFALVFQSCIYHALIKLTPHHCLLILYYTAPLLLNSLQCITLYYLRVQVHCVLILLALCHPLFLS